MTLPWKALAKEYRRQNELLGSQNDDLWRDYGRLCSHDQQYKRKHATREIVVDGKAYELRGYDKGFKRGWARAAAAAFGMIGMAEAIRGRNEWWNGWKCQVCEFSNEGPTTSGVCAACGHAVGTTLDGSRR